MAFVDQKENTAFVHIEVAYQGTHVTDLSQLMTLA